MGPPVLPMVAPGDMACQANLGWSPAHWRDGLAYDYLRRCSGPALAWEWLRRDPGYRLAARGRVSRARTSPAIVDVDEAAAPWGLHAFECPDLPAPLARPMWRREWLPGVLDAATVRGRSLAQQFDLTRFAEFATVALGSTGAEHLLLTDGYAGLRIDVAGSLLRGPVYVTYQLGGLSHARAPLATLLGLLRLNEVGRLTPQIHGRRGDRMMLLLRACDALAVGANQRDIARELVDVDAGMPRWRSELPSVRSRSQRLVRAVRALASGDYRRLLR